MSILTTPAILLRSYPYSESSLVLRFLAAEAGVLPAIAKGARRRGKGRGGVYDTFSEGTLTVYLRSSRELQTVKDFDVDRSRIGLGRHPLRFGGAGLASELVLRHAGEEANPPLYRRLSGALDRLEETPKNVLLPALLAEAWALVVVLGYAPELRRCVRCGGGLGEGEVGRFDYGAGGIRCAGCGTEGDGPRIGPGAREHLRTLSAGEVPGDFSHGAVHLRILGDFVTYHVSGGRPLRSIDFLSGELDAAGEVDAGTTV